MDINSVSTGQRVQLKPGYLELIRVRRTGSVTSVGRKYIYVRFDGGEREHRLRPENLRPVRTLNVV